MSITSRDDHICVSSVTRTINSGWNTSAPSPSGLPIGSVIFDFATQQLKVSDGYNWQTLEDSTSVALSKSTAKVIAWAEQKMRQEAEEQELLNKFPSLKQAQEHYNTMLSLVKSYEKQPEK